MPKKNKEKTLNRFFFRFWNRGRCRRCRSRSTAVSWRRAAPTSASWCGTWPTATCWPSSPATPWPFAVWPSGISLSLPFFVLLFFFHFVPFRYRIGVVEVLLVVFFSLKNNEMLFESELSLSKCRLQFSRFLWFMNVSGFSKFQHVNDLQRRQCSFFWLVGWFGSLSDAFQGETR